MKRIKERLQEQGKSEEEIKAFETGAQAYAGKVAKTFKDWEFYIGESMNSDGM